MDEEVPDETIPPETDETASEEPVQPEADAAVDVQAASQIIASETTTAYSYIYASGKLLQEKVTTNGTTETHNFFYDNTGKPYAMQVNGTTYYYVTNLQGDVMGLVDTSGNSVASYTYDPYGKVLTATGALAEKNPLRYRGYYYDSESGLYYLQTRYYDPATRRFVNADAYASTGQGIIGTNMFAYCANNTKNLSDYTGSVPCFAICLYEPQHTGASQKVNVTISAGYTGGLSSGFWAFSGQVAQTIDGEGNLGLQVCGTAGLATGTPGASVGRYWTITNAPSIKKLNDFGCAIGVTAQIPGVPIGLAVDINIIPDKEKDDVYWGVSVSVLAGLVGYDFHVTLGNTRTLSSVNLIEVLVDFANALQGR